MSENNDTELDALREQTQKGSRLQDDAPTSFKEDVAVALAAVEDREGQPMLSIYDEHLRAFLEAIEADEQREGEFRAAVAEAAGRSDDGDKRSPLLANLLRVGIQEVDEEMFELAREAAAEQADF